jgi:hypothetical protein
MIIYFISNTNFSGLCNRWSSFHSDMQSPLHLRDSELNWPIKSCMCICGIMHAYMYITNIFVKMSTKKYCNFWENGKKTYETHMNKFILCHLKHSLKLSSQIMNLENAYVFYVLIWTCQKIDINSQFGQQVHMVLGPSWGNNYKCIWLKATCTVLGL